MKAFVIAEAASTHDGDLGKALELVDIATKAGADACKFQYWSSAERLAQRRNALDYLPVYQRYQIPVGWLSVLSGRCKDNGIEFMCTAFLQEDIGVVEPFVSRFKIASFEAGDKTFVRSHNLFPKPVVLSTGMMGMEQAQESAGRLTACEAVLHCVSKYPCKSVDVEVITEMRQVFGRVGLSDHTGRTISGALAIAAGADVVEVHYRHPDTDPENPDCAPAVASLKDYVTLCRAAEEYRLGGVKYPQADELLRYRCQRD